MWRGEGHKDQCAVTIHAIPSRETARTHKQVRTLHLYLKALYNHDYAHVL